MQDNPLLTLAHPLPFDRVRAEHVEPAVLDLIAQSRAAIDQIAGAGNLSYEGTFQALESATEQLEIVMGVVEHLESVATSDALRDAYNKILPAVSQFYSSITLHAGLYQALCGAAARMDHDSLSPIQQRYVKKTLDDFRRHGAELDETGKQALRRIDQALSERTTLFSQNVLDSTNAFEIYVDESRISGLPESALAMARESATARGQTGYRFTLQAPSVTPVLNYADDAALREQVWTAFNQRGRGKYDNVPLLKEILTLRSEKARLLGFKDFSDLVTHDRMAKTGEHAAAFVEDLKLKTQAAYRKENEELLAFRRSLEGPDAPELKPWDVGYYAEKQRQALYDFDEEQLRPYFSADRVLKGAFDLATSLYGVTFEPASLPVWHDSVKSHRIVDRSGRELGFFYTDLYPRESKRDGAWMHGLVASAPPTPHVALFCLNAQPPTRDLPSLLSFRDVETVFHEFGHLLHHCLSQVPVRSLSCTRVAQDFVELPSQIMENWCTESAALNRFASHYKTNAPIPDELIHRLLRARHFRAANAQMRQLGFAAVDLALHRDFDPTSDTNVLDFANEILQQYAVVQLPADYAMIASFGHLFSHSVGYAAGYYSYKWAEVLDADAFSRFRAEGIFNPTVGQAFVDAILSRGDSADPQDLFQEFMGRAPRLEPMLERLGLLARAS
jgi:oligopeptidase A